MPHKGLIIFCLALVTMLSVNANYSAKNICLDNIKQSLPEICKFYEQKCQDCYTTKYITQCVKYCKNTLTGKNCMDQCSGTKKDWCEQQSEHCTKCHSSWKECQCPEGMTLKRGNDGSRTCVLEECDEGTWRAADSKCTDCEKCNERCKRCKNSADNCQECKEGSCLVEGNKCVDPKTYVCPSGYKLNQKSGCPKCVKTCPVGMYGDAQSKECKKCEKGCKSCKGSADNCDVCDESHCLYQNKCVKPDFKCPDSTYKKTEGKCFKCVQCNKCSKQTWCDATTNTCNNVCTKPKFIINHQCVDKCPQTSSTVLENLNPSSAQTLTRSTSQNYNGWRSNRILKSTKCANDYLIGGYGVLGNKAYLKKTYTNLPAHTKIKLQFTVYLLDSWDNEQLQMYIDNKKVKAIQRQYRSGKQICGWNHRTYKNDQVYTFTIETAHTASSCTVMFKDTLNQGAYDESWGIQDLSVSMEGGMLYKRIIDGQAQCVPCDQCGSNEYCSNDQECKVCEKPKFIWNGECIEKCKEGTYKALDKATGKYKCDTDCPDGQYADAVSRECKNCDKKCKKCVGSATTCVYPCPRPLIFKNNDCVEKCPEGNFAFGMTDLNFFQCDSGNEDCACGKCNENCKSCIGPNTDQCLECKDKSKYLVDGKCVDKCPKGKYADKDSMSCSCCNEHCASCDGPGINQCFSCTNGATLIGNTCYPKSSTVKTYINSQKKTYQSLL